MDKGVLFPGFEREKTIGFEKRGIKCTGPEEL